MLLSTKCLRKSNAHHWILSDFLQQTFYNQTQQLSSYTKKCQNSASYSSNIFITGRFLLPWLVELELGVGVAERHLAVYDDFPVLLTVQDRQI